MDQSVTFWKRVKRKDGDPHRHVTGTCRHVMDKTTELTTNMKIAVLHGTPDGSRMQKRKGTSLIKHVTRITTIMHDKSYNQI